MEFELGLVTSIFFFQSVTFLNLFAHDCKGQACYSVSDSFALLILE